jgi:hypothetical protein
MKLQLLIMAQLLLASNALAVGWYETPCHTLSDTFLDAKKSMQNCIENLQQGKEEKDDAPRCLKELEEMTEKAKVLRDCRSSARCISAVLSTMVSGDVHQRDAANLKRD